MAGLVAVLLVVPLLAVGEASDSEARARARAEMFAAGASVAARGADEIQGYFARVRRELLATAAGDLRTAVAARDSEGMMLGVVRAVAAAGGPDSAPIATRAALTDARGGLLLELVTPACQTRLRCASASDLVEQARGHYDPEAIALLAARNPAVRSWLSDPFVPQSDGQSSYTNPLIPQQPARTSERSREATVAIGTLLTASDTSLVPLGMLVVDIPVADAVYGELHGLLDRAEDAYVIDRSGHLVTSARDVGVAPLADLSATPLVSAALRSPSSRPTGAASSVQGYADDPVRGVVRPFAGVVMRFREVALCGPCGQIAATGNDLYGWQVLVVPDQTALRASETTMDDLRAARAALGLLLLLAAFLLATALRAVSREGAALAQSSRELAAASQHKSEFLANMSHELRTPLNAIIGFSDVLAQRMAGELNARQADYVQDIASSGRHLLDLVNEILDLSKIEAGRMELNTSEFSVSETVRAALTFVRERAARHSIELAADVPGNVGTVTADERKVRQVLVNLLSNAVKFTPDGGRVAVSGERDNGEVRISVRDTGIGIAPEDRPKIFEEFRQVGKVQDRSHEGTGLGLTLAKRFIELHGGRMSVESEVGKGTMFTFVLPAKASAAEAGRA